MRSEEKRCALEFGGLVGRIVTVLNAQLLAFLSSILDTYDSILLPSFTLDRLGDFLFQVVNAGSTAPKSRILHQFSMQGQIGFNAFDDRFGQGDCHARNRLFAGISIRNQLAY